jgi:hypothetical protein
MATSIASPLFALVIAMTPVPDWHKRDPDQRVTYLISRLDAIIAKADEGEFALGFLLDCLSSLSLAPGFDKNPALTFKIVIKKEAFDDRGAEPFDPERIGIKFPATIRDVRLESVLKLVCDQIDGACVIRDENIEIIPTSQFRKELNMAADDKRPLYPIVYRLYSAMPLDKVVSELAKQYHAKIEIAPDAEATAKSAVTVRLLNLPLEMALEKLAAETELKLERKSNVYYLAAPLKRK